MWRAAYKSIRAFLLFAVLAVCAQCHAGIAYRVSAIDIASGAPFSWEFNAKPQADAWAAEIRGRTAPSFAANPPKVYRDIKVAAIDSIPTNKLLNDAKQALDQSGQAKKAIDKVKQAKEVAEKAKKATEDGWLKAATPKEHQSGDTIGEYRDRIKKSVNEVLKAKDTLTAGVSGMTEKRFNEINSVVSDYNRTVTDLKSGPLAGLFSDLQEMKSAGIPGTPMTPQAAQERFLTAQAKTEEVQLRLLRHELAESKDKLQAEIGQIAEDKAAGIDVTARERKFDEEVIKFDERRERLQKDVETFAKDKEKLETVRDAIREEMQLAERKRLDEERRQKVAGELAKVRKEQQERVRREEDRLAQQRQMAQQERKTTQQPQVQIAGTRWKSGGGYGFYLWRFDSNGTFTMRHMAPDGIHEVSAGHSNGTYTLNGSAISITDKGSAKTYSGEVSAKTMTLSGWGSLTRQ